ncbi:hypothetical protein WN55_07092 [Dufourea novaeangliae]|uniref:Uncharacterized protein n=1 Tax=Dufourea novaeangliae TaxID=178035 RepID=A0A154P0Y8_DUFNO|nr:hypothetical protein WN55_07092 [Dufourea novaeangliae]
MRSLRPVPTLRHGEKSVFIYKDLATTQHVFLRRDTVKKPLQASYCGPYPVIQRNQKTFVIRINGRDTNVSVDRLKPAYTLADINFKVESKTVQFRQ